MHKNDDGTVTVELQHPIISEKKVNGDIQKEEITKVKFRQFSFGDFKALADQNFKNDSQEAYFVIKRLACGVSQDAFDKISGVDLQNCIKAAEGFLQQSQET